MELLIVIAIMGVMVTLAIPRLDGNRYAADSNVRMVRSLMQQAQRRALLQQHDVILSFDVAADVIRIIEDADNSGSLNAGESVQIRMLTDHGHFVAPPAGITGPVAAALVGDNLKTIDGLPSVIFHRSGSASSNVEIYMRVKGKRSDWLRGVTLLQSTGRTEWFKYVGSQWKDGKS